MLYIYYTVLDSIADDCELIEESIKDGKLLSWDLVSDIFKSDDIYVPDAAEAIKGALLHNQMEQMEC